MNDEQASLAALHALGALDADEARRLERDAEHDTDLAVELAAQRSVAAQLLNGFADLAPAPSPTFWDRVRRAPSTEGSDSPRRSRRRLAPPGWWGAVLGAAAVAFLVVGVLAGSRLGGGEASLDRDPGAALPGAETIVARLDPATEEGGPSITGYVEPDGSGILVADSLPPLAADRTYQLWVILEDRIVSAAVLGNDPATTEFRAEGDVVGLAVSDEVAGGVVVSENTPVVVWLADG